MSELILVFEVCKDCQQHRWCTRHVESTYEMMLSQQQNSIRAYQIPGLTMLHNEYPEGWRGSENIPVPQQVIRGSSEGLETLQPRMGAFEVSTVYQGVPILFFSKLQSSMWSHHDALAKRIADFAKDAESMRPDELRTKYQTPGKLRRQQRSPSPRGNFGQTQSSAPFTQTGRSVMAATSQPAVQPAPPQEPKEEKKQDPPTETVEEPQPQPAAEQKPLAGEAEAPEVQATEAAQEGTATPQATPAAEDEIVPQNAIEEQILVMVNQMFSEQDKDGSGYLERTEARAMVKDILKELGDEGEKDEAEIDQAWQDQDKNGDGKISKREFFDFTKGMIGM